MSENETQNSNTTTSGTNYALPMSIIVAAALIAGAWVYSSGLKNPNSAGEPNNPQLGQVSNPTPQSETIILKPVDASDHIRGSANAPVKIVEYSDLECPFCKSFHKTMQEVMAQYGASGKVAWVYRHYPLDALHSKARASAEGAECAAEQGGNDKFWAYVDTYFSMTPSNNQVDLAILPQIAQSIGVNVNKFNTCVAAKKYEAKIDASIKDAEGAGAQGTPYSVVIAKDGKTYAINGADSYDNVRAIIDQALR